MFYQPRPYLAIEAELIELKNDASQTNLSGAAPVVIRVMQVLEELKGAGLTIQDEYLKQWAEAITETNLNAEC